MKKTESEPTKSISLVVGLWGLGLSGLIAAIEVVAGDSTGLRSWLLPFAPWSLALFPYAMKRSRERERETQVATSTMNLTMPKIRRQNNKGCCEVSAIAVTSSAPFG